MSSPVFKIASEPMSITSLNQELRDESAGAYASFEGWVRNLNDSKVVISLEYEAHTAVATSEGEKILVEAIEKFELIAARSFHRIGHLQIGDCAVWVGVSAMHRGPAFEGCRYIIDELKHRLPIWKKEYYLNGNSSWINCQTGNT